MKNFYVLCLFSCSVFSLFAQPKTTKSPAKVKPPKVVEVQQELESWESLGPILREEVDGSIGYVDEGEYYPTGFALVDYKKSPKAELNLPEFRNKSGDVDLEVYEKVKS